jgi:hypothetical protein
VDTAIAPLLKAILVALAVSGVATTGYIYYNGAAMTFPFMTYKYFSPNRAFRDDIMN